MQRSLKSVLSLIFIIGSLVFVTSTSSATTYSSCETVFWGSLDDGDFPVQPSGVHIRNVRAGRHQCFDRLVLDFDGAAPEFSASYQPQIIQDGSGDVFNLDGGAALEVRFGGISYDEQTGESTYSPADSSSVIDATGYETFRQVAFLNSFEGQSQLGLGLRGRLPFRIFVVEGGPAGGDRIVIDVAHNW